MSKQLRFLPPQGKAEHHMALTSGHSCVIYLVSPEDGKEGTVIPDLFRRHAIADGCEVVGMESAPKASLSGNEKTDLIIKAIAAVMERQDPDELTGDGRPKLDALKGVTGFGVTKNQFEGAWPLYVESLGEGDKDDE